MATSLPTQRTRPTEDDHVLSWTLGVCTLWKPHWRCQTPQGPGEGSALGLCCHQPLPRGVYGSPASHCRALAFARLSGWVLVGPVPSLLALRLSLSLDHP